MTTTVKPRPRARRKASPEPTGITAISVRGYKSIADEIRIDIRPLTILAGENSSGKSSIMQPLLLQKQTLEATYDPGALLLNGPHVRFTSAAQMLSRLPGREVGREFTVGAHIDSSQISTSYEQTTTRPLDIGELRFQSSGETLALKRKMTHEELERTFQEWGRHWKWSQETQHRAFTLERARCFLRVKAQFLERAADGGPIQAIAWIDPARSFEVHLQRIIHVPGLRGNPERTYPTSNFQPAVQGTFEPYVASIVKHWQSEKAPQVSQLDGALESLGLTWKVEARQIDDTRVELRVGRLPHCARGGAKDLVNIVDVGFGVSQTLPVVVALLAAEPGQLVYIEEPELHLHPGAHEAMAEVLAHAARRGVRVVVETHSPLLVLAVQTLVAQGKLPAKEVLLHWFARDDAGVTHVSTAELDDFGAFDDWPEDFDDAMIGAEERYLTAASKALRKRRRAG